MLLEAGSETTAATLIAFVQAMVLYPEVQKKAREEIDRVCGADRLPTMDDEPNMLYIRCCQKEVLRWLPSLPLGLPHAVIQDDEYRGYTIPKGAMVILNAWAVHMDPTRFPSPAMFDPSRWEQDSPPSTFAFGAGRRLCPGSHIAERSLFLGIARMLWGFTFEPAPSGPLPTAHDFADGMSAHLRPFHTAITPRSDARARLIQDELANARDTVLDEALQWCAAPGGLRMGGYRPETELADKRGGTKEGV